MMLALDFPSHTIIAVIFEQFLLVENKTKSAFCTRTLALGICLKERSAAYQLSTSALEYHVGT